MEVHRRFSFRGRVNSGYAHWSHKGIKNVITLYLNKITDDVFEIFGWPKHTLMFEELFLILFSEIDLHEWLHLFIRRESGMKNTYIVTQDVEDWIYMVVDEVVCCWCDKDEN